MKKFTALLIVLLLLCATTSAYAAGNVFTVIPDDYYIHFFAGATVQGLLQKHEASPMESFFMTIGLALVKEAVDSAILGGQFNAAEAAVTVLGASVMFYL